jgi:hypothetical protein
MLTRTPFIVKKAPALLHIDLAEAQLPGDKVSLHVSKLYSLKKIMLSQSHQI